MGGAPGRLRPHGSHRRRYLPVVARVDQPGAVTSWRVKVGVVGRAEGAVEVPQPLPAGGDVAVDLVSQVLDGGQRGSRVRESPDRPATPVRALTWQSMLPSQRRLCGRQV